MDRSQLLGLLVGLGLTIGGGYAVYDHYDQRAEARQVEAVVTESYVATGTGTEDDAAVVEYRYTVNGTTYTGAQICPVRGVNCYGDAERIAASNPKGERITVYVDPENPRDAYLIQPGPPYGLLFVTGFGVATLLLGSVELSG